MCQVRISFPVEAKWSSCFSRLLTCVIWCQTATVNCLSEELSSYAFLGVVIPNLAVDPASEMAVDPWINGTACGAVPLQPLQLFVLCVLWIAGGSERLASLLLRCLAQSAERASDDTDVKGMLQGAIFPSLDKNKSAIIQGVSRF